MTECVQCGRPARDSAGGWSPGECCIAGSLFACSWACAKLWRDAHCVPGTEIEEPSGAGPNRILRAVYTWCAMAAARGESNEPQ